MIREASPPEIVAEVPWVLVAIIVVVSAFVAWRVVDATKRTIWAALKRRAHATGREAPWWMPLLGLVAVSVGAIVGAGIAAIDWHPGYGAALGAAAGAQPVWIIKAVKVWIRARTGDVE
jgi:hypothetical protein